MRAAIYARVSTDKQTHHSQMLELRAFCVRRDWSAAEYLDTLSGSKFTRAGLDKLMSDVRRGKIDAVVCYKLDRIGRSLPHLALLIQELTNNRCALVCTSQGI